MAAYPSTLPAPLAPGYSLQPMDQTIRTDMEFGAARVRRRSTARLDGVPVVFNYTDAQLATFRTWFDDDATGAAGGAAWFTIALKVGTGGAVSVEARFKGTFRAELNGGQRWAVSAELEVR